MTTAITFSRQNDAGSRKSTTQYWENLVLVVVLIFESKALFCFLSGSKMTTGSFNNQSFDIAVSDTVVNVSRRLFFHYLRGFGICTCSKVGKENSSFNLDQISWWIWNYFVGMRSSFRTLSSSVFTVCKMLTFWLWNKVCLTVWNAHVRVRPNAKQVSTLFNQCKLYFGNQSSSPQFDFNYSEWRGYHDGFSFRRQSL